MRQSGVELLKILAMFLIIVNHVTQTLQADNPYISYHDYWLGELSGATTDFLPLLLKIFRYSGMLGNNIFFFCSAWFLLDKKPADSRKITRLLSDVWIISVVIFLITALCMKGNIDKSFILSQFFPTMSQNNWYATTYLLFLPLYPLLNRMIDSFDRQSLFRAILFSLLLRCFFSANLLRFVTFYLIIAYTKRYLKDFSSNVKYNLALLLFSAFGLIFSSVLFNALGLYVPLFSRILTSLWTLYNPFAFSFALAALNLSLRLPLRNEAVNYISSMSLFIYLIHDNQLVRTYLRPWIWQKIYIFWGYSHIILWIFTYSIILFLCSFAASAFYKAVIQKTVWRISDALFARVFRLWKKLENRLLSLS